MICKVCGKNNEEDAKYCCVCGAELEENDTLKCSNCGNVNPKGAVFCGKCGAKIGATQTSEDHKDLGTVCKICGTENIVGTKFCSVCGSQLTSSYGNVSTVSYSPKTDLMYTENSLADKLATTSMILGIISAAVNIFCVLFVIAILAGIASVILAIIALVKKTSLRGKAIAGLVLGIVGFIIGAMILAWVAVYMSDPDYWNSILENAYGNGQYIRFIMNYIKF